MDTTTKMAFVTAFVIVATLLLLFGGGMMMQMPAKSQSEAQGSAK